MTDRFVCTKNHSIFIFSRNLLRIRSCDCKCRTTKRGAENRGKEAKRNDIIDINLGKLYLISDTLTIIFCFLYD